MENILIVDDQELTRLILAQFVGRIGSNVRSKIFEAPLAALDWVSRNTVAMVIVDYRMPGIDGIEFTRRFRMLPHCRDVPVVMISVVDDPDKAIRYQALEAGVIDFLPKPIDYTEWLARCRNILNIRRQQNLDPVHDEVTGILFRITQSFNGRNPWRLASISRRIAEQLGLSLMECDLIERASPLNDLGHMVASGVLLSRPVALLQTERVMMQQHTLLGYRLLQGGATEFLHRAANIALSHHERFDGKGYPHGFKGYDIAREARIVAVADVVDALLSDRPYRKAWPVERVLEHLLSERGRRLDPDCVDAFLQRWKKILLPVTGQVPGSSCG